MGWVFVEGVVSQRYRPVRHFFANFFKWNRYIHSGPMNNPGEALFVSLLLFKSETQGMTFQSSISIFIVYFVGIRCITIFEWVLFLYWSQAVYMAL